MPFDLARAVNRLRRHHARPRTLEETVRLALNFDGRGSFRVTAAQVPSEITDLARAVAALKPKRILEIGTADGSTLLIWANIASERVISCDIKPMAIQSMLFKRFPPPASGCRVTLLSGNSHDPAFKSLVERHLEGEQVDFLFIDGDHTEAGVSADYEAYRSLVRPGGLIAFHDIVEKQPLPQNQVYYFWKKIKREADTEEFVQDPGQCGYGIGIVRVPGK